MAALSHRERVIKALNHEEPDRVPMDLAGASTAGINAAAYAKLVEYLGLTDEVSNLQLAHRERTATPSEALLQRFDIDFRRLTLGTADRAPKVGPNDQSFRDEWGVTWIRPEGGHFLTDAEPFSRQEPTLAELERYPWPDPRDAGRIRGLKEKARRLREETDYAIVLGLPYGIVRESQRMRGFTEWLEDLLINPILAEAIMEHCLTVSAGIAELVLSEVGDYVDVVMFPDDLGIQDRPYMRPEVYQKRVKPYHRRLVEAIKGKTKAKVLLHSDGSVYRLIPDLIDIGIDALNPVQVSAKDMDTRRLKTEFGAHLCFWGAIDTHRVLPMGTPEDVRNEVKTRMRDLGPGGGYVVASVHNIQADVPPQNIAAMFEAVLEHGRYPLPG